MYQFPFGTVGTAYCITKEHRTAMTPLIAYYRAPWRPRIDSGALFAPGFKFRLVGD